MNLTKSRHEASHLYESLNSPNLIRNLRFNDSKMEALEDITAVDQNVPKAKLGNIGQQFTPYVKNKDGEASSTPNISNDGEWYHWLSNNNLVNMFPEDCVPKVVRVLQMFATPLYNEFAGVMEELQKLQKENMELTKQWKEANGMGQYYENLESEYTKLQNDYVTLRDHCTELKKSQVRDFGRNDNKTSDPMETRTGMRTWTRNRNDMLVESSEQFESLSDFSPTEALLLQGTPLNKDMATFHKQVIPTRTGTGTGTGTGVGMGNNQHAINQKLNEISMNLQRLLDREYQTNQCIEQLKKYQMQISEISSSLLPWSSKWRDDNNGTQKQTQWDEKRFGCFQTNWDQGKLQNAIANEKEKNDVLAMLEKHLQAIEKKQDLQKASIDCYFQGFRDMMEKQLKDAISLLRSHILLDNPRKIQHTHKFGASRLQTSLELNGNDSSFLIGYSDEEKGDNDQKLHEHKSNIGSGTNVGVGALQLSPILPNKTSAIITKKIHLESSGCDCNAVFHHLCLSILAQSSQMSNEIFDQMFQIILSVVVALGSPQHYVCKSDKLHSKINKFVLRLNGEMSVFVDKWIKSLLKQVVTDMQNSKDKQHISSALKDICTLCEKPNNSNKIVVDEGKIADEIKSKVVLKDVWVFWICTLGAGLLFGVCFSLVIPKTTFCPADFV